MEEKLYDGQRIRLVIGVRWYEDADEFDDDFTEVRRSSVEKRRALERFARSAKWREYNRDFTGYIRKMCIPYYGERGFRMTRLRTSVDSPTTMVVEGVLESIPQEEIRRMYDESEALNKTWSDRYVVKATKRDLLWLVVASFSKMNHSTDFTVPYARGKMMFYLISPRLPPGDVGTCGRPRRAHKIY